MMRSVIRLLARPQFSLLGLLLLITASALVIQFAVLPAYRRSARKNILERITELGGQWVDLDTEVPKRRLLLQGERVEDDFVHDLADVVHLVPELTQFDLLKTSVTDEAWQDLLRRESNIGHYVLFENAITDEAIEQAQKDYPEIKIEKRRPDAIAAQLAAAPIPPSAIISMAHDPSSDQLLFGSGDGRLHRMGLTNSQDRVSQAKHANWVFDLAISPSGDWIATAGGDNKLLLHRATDLKTIATGMGHREDVHAVVWLDESRLVTSGDDWTLRLWQVEGDSTEAAPVVSEIASAVAHERQVPRVIRIDQETVLTVSRDHSLRRWHVGTEGFELRQTYVGHRDDCMEASVRPDGRELASVGYDGQLILWSGESGEPRLRHQLGEGRLFCLNVDWDARLALVGSKSGVQLVRLDSGRPLRRRADQPYVSRILRVGETFFTADGFGRIFQRDSETLEVKRRFQLFEGDLDVYSDQGFQIVGTARGEREHWIAGAFTFRGLSVSKGRREIKETDHGLIDPRPVSVIDDEAGQVYGSTSQSMFHPPSSA
ncbi:MAG: hypothetical protein AAFU85_22550 [Planctomycetota bacterium]